MAALRLARRERQGGPVRASRLHRTAGSRGVLGRRWEFAASARAQGSSAAARSEMSQVLASAARAKADTAAWSVRLDAQVGAGGRPEDLIDELDAEESEGASGILRLATDALEGSAAVSGPRERSPSKRSQSGRRSLLRRGGSGVGVWPALEQTVRWQHHAQRARWRHWRRRCWRAKEGGAGERGRGRG